MKARYPHTLILPNFKAEVVDLMNSKWSRRRFIQTGALALPMIKVKSAGSIQTVTGRIPSKAMCKTLIHEHVLVDFIGADRISPDRWKKEDVILKVLPYLKELKQLGVDTFMECTPAHLGRDPALLKSLADQSGLQILTNTGYYGAVGNKYLPAWAFTETAEQLAQRWIDEFENGMERTGIKPGFIKIGVDPGRLSELHRKLIRAAGLTHLQTGLTICSHTGMAIPAFEQIEILSAMKVHPSAFVWTHAQNEPDHSMQIKAARSGTWISLDGVGWGDVKKYADNLQTLKVAGVLNRVLISHDAGWYKPGEPDGGSFIGYSRIFKELIPLLNTRGFRKKDISQLLETNPEKAFTIQVRKS